jgi:hypothetical protein
LLLGAIDREVGGIAISGKRGTAKTVMARGLHAMLPPIEVVVGSISNADPNNPEEYCPYTMQLLYVLLAYLVMLAPLCFVSLLGYPSNIISSNTYDIQLIIIFLKCFVSLLG